MAVACDSYDIKEKENILGEATVSFSVFPSLSTGISVNSLNFRLQIIKKSMLCHIENSKTRGQTV